MESVINGCKGVLLFFFQFPTLQQ